ncbi:MAG: hypothetical protein IJE10_10825 [Clostridia bacterium]|nr:hypothetical protein [Clostridia bacterium]
MEFTYERENGTEKYEGYEWDNVWIDRAKNLERNRVLYIGDSISCGTRRVATLRSEEQILFDGFGTSKGLDNPFFCDAIALFAKQEARRDAVLFNNGLHGWHLEDSTEYKAYYEKMVQFLISFFPDTPVFLVLSSYLADPERNARVLARNEAVISLAEKYHLKVIDVYAVTEKMPEKQTDGVHFNSEGYEAIADKLLTFLKENVDAFNEVHL